jgi:hypothetical protein
VHVAEQDVAVDLSAAAIRIILEYARTAVDYDVAAVHTHLEACGVGAKEKRVPFGKRCRALAAVDFY